MILEKMVTYSHPGDSNVRFRQYAKDALPAWANDVKELPEIDTEKVHDVEVEGIDVDDYPELTDAYISFATYEGREMTELELEALNLNVYFVHEEALKRVRNAF